MFRHIFMPLNEHADDGLGAVGRAFHQAAKYLRNMKCEGGAGWTHGHLPIDFLYRHSIELFLKSMIVVIHRRLHLPTDEKDYEPIPRIEVGDSRKSIYSVHGVRLLFNAMKDMVTSHRKTLSEIAKTDWSDIPQELEIWILVIDSIDPRSTFFRYPSTRTPEVDRQKSSFKSIDPTELSERMQTDRRGQFAFLMLDQDDAVIESFVLDDKPLPELRNALEKASETLVGAQLGVMIELGQAISG